MKRPKDLNIFVFETIVFFTGKLLRKIKSAVKTVRKYFVNYTFSVLSAIRGMVVNTNSPPVSFIRKVSPVNSFLVYFFSQEEKT